MAEGTTSPCSDPRGSPTDPATVQPIVSRKIWGLALFGLAIAIAVVAGTFYLLDEDEGSENAGSDPRVLVDLTRSGGFTGITQQLIVFGDGRAILTTGEGTPDAETTEADLTPDTFERLQRVLPEVVSTLDEEPEPKLTCADCFQYDLIYDGVRYTFFELPKVKQITMLIRVLDETICETRSRPDCS